MKRCPTCREPRDDSAFTRVVDGERLPTRECIGCIARAARQQHREQHARDRRGVQR